jgi:hypothetical protein
VPRCVDPKKATRKKYKGWTTLKKLKDLHSRVEQHALRQWPRATPPIVFRLRLALQFCGAIKAVLHLKFITVG